MKKPKMDAYARALEKKHKFYSRKPCPFCGHGASSWGFNVVLGHYYYCLGAKCLAHGPIRATKRGAAIAWGKRK